MFRWPLRITHWIIVTQKSYLSSVKIKVGPSIGLIEAMKMKNEIRAPKSGTVKDLHFRKDSSVNTDDILAVVK